jgi:mycothiol synthase
MALGDAAALAELIGVCDTEAIGHPDITVADVEGELRATGYRCWGIEAADGSLVGMTWVQHRPNHPHVNADVQTRPGAPEALGPQLLAFARERAADVDPALPVQVFSYATADRLRGWLQAAGGEVIRHFWRMAIDLADAPPPAPVPPEGVVVRGVADAEPDLRAVHQVLTEAFRDHFGSHPSEFDAWLARQRVGTGPDVSLWRLAELDGQPVAALVARQWPDAGWVQMLGTRRDARGRGLGRALLLSSFGEFHRRGTRRVELGVDASNPTGAVGLYESAGMRQSFSAELYQLPPSCGPSPAGSTRSDSKNV